MIRRLLLPAIAAALLGGCMSAGYSYRQGSGDYYYGAPSVEYRYYGGFSYGWPYPYGYGASPYGYGYGYPYGYRQYYGDPYRNYYGYPYGNSYHHHHRHPAPTVVPRVDDTTPDGNRSHWRDLDRLRRRDHVDRNMQMAPRAIGVPQPRSEPQADPAPRASALGGMMRRARERAGDDEATP